MSRSEQKTQPFTALAGGLGEMEATTISLTNNSTYGISKGISQKLGPAYPMGNKR